MSDILLSKKTNNVDISTISFVILFPGFFFYNFAVARDLIPPFVDGYFGIVSFILLIPLLLSTSKVFLLNYKSKSLLIFATIYIYTLTIVIINYLLDKPYRFSGELLFWSLSGLLFNLIMMLIAAGISYQKISKIGIYLLFLMFVVVVLNIGDRGIFYLKLEAFDDLYVSTYQGFARSIVFLALILTSIYIGNFKYGFSIFTISIATLYLNGARTEFVGYLFSSILLFVLFSFKDGKSILTSIVIFVTTYFVIQYLSYTYSDSRMLQIFMIDESTSFQARSELSKYGINVINNNPIFGNYGSYVELGGIGSYPHSLLSAWVNLGLIGFILYIILFFNLIKQAIINFRKSLNSAEYRVFLIYLIFTLFSVSFSKEYNYMSIGFLIGTFLKFKKSK